MKEFALNKDTSSNRSSIEEDESGEQSSLISANKLTNSNSDSDMTNNNYSHNDFQNSNVNIDINLSKETSGTHKATDNYSSSNNNSSNKNHSNHSSNNKSNQKTNNNNNNKKENKDNDIIIPPEDLALLTPSALKLLKFRQVIRLVGFITFAIVGKMCLFSFILPFWGETQSIVKYVSPGVYETSTLHIGVLFKYISDGPNHPTFTHWSFAIPALFIFLSLVSLAANGLIYEHCRREMSLGDKHVNLHLIAVTLPAVQIALQIGAFFIFGHYAMPTQIDPLLHPEPYEWNSSVYGGSIYELFVILSLEFCQIFINASQAYVVYHVPANVLKLDASGDIDLSKLHDKLAKENSKSLKELEMQSV